MKILNLLTILVFILGMNLSCSAQAEKKPSKKTVSQANDVEVYYFHYTRRCATCNAVEKVSEEAVKELYGDRIPFKSFNLDDPEGKEKASQLEISGQSLLIVSGDQKINITNEGFMHARSNPGKLKQIISGKLSSLL